MRIGPSQSPAYKCARQSQRCAVIKGRRTIAAFITIGYTAMKLAAIEKTGAMMEMRVNPDYHALRIDELELTADYQMKLQEERERARAERDLLREQRRVEAELAAERERLDKERAHYVTVLETLHAKGDQKAIDDLTARLADIDAAIEATDYRTANIRAGYVYVISNVGAFGPDVVRIGMTAGRHRPRPADTTCAPSQVSRPPPARHPRSSPPSRTRARHESDRPSAPPAHAARPGTSSTYSLT